MVKKLKGIILGVLLISLSLYLFFTSNIKDDKSPIDNLPDYDYISEINTLIKEKRWSEANILCEDVIALDLPCAQDAAKLKKQTEKESKKIKNHLYKAVKGFVTGSPDNSIEELGGSIASDMFLYGDIRDLVKQGYYKITGKETDPVIVALASLGIATEAIDAIDWVPAVLKGFRKVGAISNSLGQFIIDISKKIVKTKKLSYAGNFFKDFKVIFDKAGFVRSSQIIKHASNADDIALLAKSTKLSPNNTYLLSRIAKENTCDTIKTLNQHPNPKSLMRKIAQKGAKSLKYVKMASRGSKIIHKQQIGKFLRQMLGEYFYILCLGLFIAGGVIIWKSLKKEIVNKQ